MEQAAGHREAVRQAAAAWAVRLSDPHLSDADRAAFEAWRAASPAHDAAFEREAATWDRFDRLRALRPADPEPDPDLLAPAPVRAQPMMRWAAAIAGAMVLSGIGVWSVAGAPAYATAVGERRLVVLEDGTKVELNTNSRIVVRYRRGERQVKLVRGEALFEVAKDARPFVVTARDRTVEADSAAFNVRIQPKAVQVIVAKGDVDVAESSLFGGPQDEAQLHAGVVGLYGEGGGVAQPIAAKRIDQALAWRHGEIALNGQTLENAVAEFNRYSKDRELVVADPAISGLRLGGYFRVDDMDGFVRALQTTFPVKATTGGDTIYLSAEG